MRASAAASTLEASEGRSRASSRSRASRSARRRATTSSSEVRSEGPMAATSRRIRLRAKRRSPLVASRRNGWPRAERNARMSIRGTPSSGRTTPSSRAVRGPASDAIPPRRCFASRCDSRRSSCWWAVAIHAAPSSAGHLVERLVADEPGSRFGRDAQCSRGRARVAVAGGEGETEPPGVLLDVREVPVGLAAPPAVMDVADREAPAGLRRDFRRAVEQGHRVRSAGDGEEDRGAAGQKPRRGGSLNCLADRVHP